MDFVGFPSAAVRGDRVFYQFLFHLVLFHGTKLFEILGKSLGSLLIFKLA